MVRPFPSIHPAEITRDAVLRLFRPIAVAGFMLVVFAGGMIGWLHHQSCLELITEQARRIGHDLTQTLQSWPADTVFGATAMTLPQLLSDTSTLRADTQRRLDSRLLQASDLLPLLKVALYDSHGKMVYTTDSSEKAAGVMIQRPATAPVSLAPEHVRQDEGGFSSQQTFVLAGRTLSSTHAYRVLFPLIVAETGDIAGAAEIYVDLQDPIETLSGNTLWMVGWLAAMLLALYGLLVVLIYRLYGFAAVSQQTAQSAQSAQSALQESEAHLSRIQDAMENTITERTLRLKQSEARFREFAESASDWLWECDQSARVTYVSEGFSRIMGIDRTMVVGRFRWDLSDLSENDEKWIAHREAIANMKPFRDFTYTFRMPNNKRRVISLSGTPIFDERANFHGFRGTGSDITVQYEAEQTILHLGRILEQSANEVLIFEDGALRLLQANRGARQNLGYAMDELSGMTVLDILPTESRPSLESRLGRLRLYPSELVVFESVFERKDKTRYPIEARVQYMAEEKPPVFVAVMQNITARKQAEQALAESEERYRSVAEMSLDALIVHVDGIIVFANQQATIIAHADQAKALIGQPISAFVAADQDRPQNLTALFSPQTASGGSVAVDESAVYKRVEVRLQRLDGSSFDAELSSSPITFGGRPAVQTVLRDITQSKIVQSQLIQTAKLATLGEMAAGMAHELSQPMNVIRMAAEGAMLERPDGSLIDSASRAALDIISGQAARMGEIIDHMRIFSRKQTDDVGLFDPVKSVQQSVSMLESQLRAEDIELTVYDQQGNQQPVWVKGRPVHLEQVVLNLLTNARDALRSRLRAEPAGLHDWQARITIVLSRHIPSPEDEAVADNQEWLRITVKDTGGGIPPEHLDRIFEPFYTTKEVGTGTGLGLSVSFSLISAMGGALDAINQDEGACFTIDLPLAQPELAPQAAHDDGPGGGEERAWDRAHLPQAVAAGVPAHVLPAFFGDDDDDEPSALIPHIMVVDDEPFATSLVKDHLLRLGYRVSTALDGEEAFEQFLEDPPDLIITDLRMPRCGGAELIERVHQHVPGLPVIVATGHLGHLETAAAELQEVAVAVIKKPISLAELAALVARHLAEPVG